MRKALLLKYVSGNTAAKETEAVLLWASKNKENARYLAHLQNLWIASNMPNETATMAELESMRDAIGIRSSKSFRRQNHWHLAFHWSAAVAIVAVAAWCGWQVGREGIGADSKLNTEQMVARQIRYRNISPAKELYTNKGVKAKLILPDSSVVILNSDTRINYPEEFANDLRVVNLSGEAYFEVVSDSLRPMIVHTAKGFSVKVMGTKFNVRAYEDDDKAETTLFSGKIDIIRDLGNKLISTSVQPWQTLVVSDKNVKTPMLKVNKTTPLDDKAWTEGRIVFNETPVYQMAKVLSRWHGYEFVIVDPAIRDYKITATFNSESLVQIMDLIQMSSLVRYRIKDNKVILSKK